MFNFSFWRAWSLSIALSPCVSMFFFLSSLISAPFVEFYIVIVVVLSELVSRTHSFSVFNHIISCRFCIKLTFSHVFIGFFGSSWFYCYLSASRKKSVLSSFSHIRLHLQSSSFVLQIDCVYCIVPFSQCAQFTLRYSQSAQQQEYVVYSNCAPLFGLVSLSLSESTYRTLNDKCQCIFIQIIWK